MDPVQRLLLVMFCSILLLLYFQRLKADLPDVHPIETVKFYYAFGYSRFLDQNEICFGNCIYSFCAASTVVVAHMHYSSSVLQLID